MMGDEERRHEIMARLLMMEFPRIHCLSQIETCLEKR
jgi:hypothetical protein